MGGISSRESRRHQRLRSCCATFEGQSTTLVCGRAPRLHQRPETRRARLRVNKASGERSALRQGADTPAGLGFMSCVVTWTSFGAGHSKRVDYVPLTNVSTRLLALAAAACTIDALHSTPLTYPGPLSLSGAASFVTVAATHQFSLPFGCLPLTPTFLVSSIVLAGATAA